MQSLAGLREKLIVWAHRKYPNRDAGRCGRGQPVRVPRHRRPALHHRPGHRPGTQRHVVLPEPTPCSDLWTPLSSSSMRSATAATHSAHSSARARPRAHRGANNQTSRDGIAPDSPARAFLYYDTLTQQVAGICHHDPTTQARVIYLGFGFEALNRPTGHPTYESRVTFFRKCHDWLIGASGIAELGPRTPPPSPFPSGPIPFLRMRSSRMPSRTRLLSDCGSSPRSEHWFGPWARVCDRPGLIRRSGMAAMTMACRSNPVSTSADWMPEPSLSAGN